MAAWRIETPHAVLAACEDDRDTIAAALAQINGRALTGLTAVGPALDVTFDFDGLRLRTFTLGSVAQEQGRPASWMLFMPDHRVLVMGPGGAWSCSSQD